MRVLIIEDEAKTAWQLLDGMRASGFEAEWADTGPRGLERALTGRFHALLVDVMLPGLSGLDLVRKVRAEGFPTPVLFLSAKGEPVDRVRGLEEGGDDYLPKPYSFPEVLARIQALLRRASMEMPASRVEIADLVWEPEAYRVLRGGQRVELSPKEYQLAALLLENRGQVVSRRQIMERVWGLDIPADGNALDVQVRRLRGKLDDPYERKLIHTVRGIGVTLEDRG
ncbi:MAG TPA: response regulator transcription factor [Holophagaceae bacterium]|jgi:two-component system copper resistance phosphate regulon response regulator CusR|nr:response regulator transcription factor [Holophagaceae bacterium]